MDDRRLIEDYLPIEAISREASSEKSVRKDRTFAQPLLIEVTGENKRDKAAKVSAARKLWVPAVNNHGGFGRWAFVEIADPSDAENTIRGQFGRRKES